MATFANTTNPTPFGVFDSDSTFQGDADNIVTFVKRKLGDDILSVELTKKMIWANFEESCFEYSAILNQYQAKSTMLNYLGYTTSSNAEQKYPRENLEYLSRFAEPYAMEAGIGGSYNTMSGSIVLTGSQQDYDLYTDLKDADDNALFTLGSNAETSSDGTLHLKGKMKIAEVFHFDPQAAYRFFDTTSAINYLNNEFSFESFTPETIFYVLPVFEDILRAGQLDTSNRVRRSNYSYEVVGTKIRIYPTPTTVMSGKKLWIRVRHYPDPLNPAYVDNSINGVSNLGNIPFGNLNYTNINSIGKQWIRQYCLALCMETLGRVRSKFGSVPIPGATVNLDGTTLIGEGRSDRDALRTSLKEMLDTLTYDKLIEMSALRAENLQKQLKYIPIPNGKAIFFG
tara:strand:+ start:421 stop:1614 length:1194 start_codon:yes stop_codon:yes gene_type:complete